MYRIEYLPSARKKLSKLPNDVGERLVRAIDGMAHNPFPPGAEKMKGRHDEYKFRVGAYRIIYKIDHGELIILVIDVGDRKEVYK